MSHTRNRAGHRKHDRIRARSAERKAGHKGERKGERNGPSGRNSPNTRNAYDSRYGAGAGRRGRAGHRRALRREAPTVVGLLLTDEDFTAMTRYASFPFHDYGRYLHHLDGLLRTLHSQGSHVAVTLFDPNGYEDYCATTRQPPDTVATRTRYIAEVTTTRAAVPYTRQPLPVLRTELAHAADRRDTWERATDALMDAGTCPDCGQDLAHCAFDRASHTLLRIVEAMGPGSHHVVCSLPTHDGPPLLAAVHLDTDPDGEIRLAETDALVLCTVMAASSVTTRPGGLVVRTTDELGTDTVRGWSLRAGEPYPLSEAEVFDAYCTDPATGEPVPPEPGVVYRAGLRLPPPAPEDGPAG